MCDLDPFPKFSHILTPFQGMYCQGKSTEQTFLLHAVDTIVNALDNGKIV